MYICISICVYTYKDIEYQLVQVVANFHVLSRYGKFLDGILFEKNSFAN